MSTPRIVSLVPSATESLRALGVDPVACTRFCEQPDLATVGGTKNPDIGRIVALDPDLVVVEREENRREDHDALVAAGLDVLVLHVRTLAEVAHEIELLAVAVGATWSPPPLPPPRTPDLRAVIPIWRRPYMSIASGTYGSSLLDHLGVENVFGGAEHAYPEITLDDMAAAGPDVVLVPTEPYAFGPDHLAELEQVAPTEVVDGQDLFWWGTRTPAALQRLGGALDVLRQRLGDGAR